MDKRTIFLFCIISYIFFAVSVWGDSIHDTAAELMEFKSEIRLDTRDPAETLGSVYEYDPRLEVYFGGYNGTSYGSYSVINMKYVNTEVPLKSVCIAENEQEFTELVTRGLLYCNKNFYIIYRNKDYSAIDIDSMVESIEEDCPLAVMGVGKYASSSSQNPITEDSIFSFTIEYKYDPEVLLEHRREAEQRAFEIIGSNVAYDMPDYLKVKTIHDYIVNNCRYGSDHETNDRPDYYTAYGALIEGKAVCQGYTQAAQMLFDICGIDNFTVSGSSEGQSHTWNAIKLEDQYYHIDMTWDDPVMSDGTDALKYDYYNVDDNTLAKDHSWDKSRYAPCTGTKYNYANTIGLMASDMNVYSQPYENFVSVFSSHKPLGEDTNESNAADSKPQIYELGIKNWSITEIGIIALVLFAVFMPFRKRK